MSELQIIKNFCSELMKELLVRGVWNPAVDFVVSADTEPYFYVRYWSADPVSDAVKNSSRSWEFVKTINMKVTGDDIPAAFNGAVVKVRAIPSRAERERDAFLELLAAATDYGRKVGIDDQFVNPLSVLAQKLSENAIEGPKP